MQIIEIVSIVIVVASFSGFMGFFLACVFYVGDCDPDDSDDTGFHFNFPRTRFVDSNGIAGQLHHTGSEYMEAIEALGLPDIYHTAEEMMDVCCSNETSLRILVEKYGVDLDELRRNVEVKNRVRGYFDTHMTQG